MKQRRMPRRAAAAARGTIDDRALATVCGADPQPQPWVVDSAPQPVPWNPHHHDI